MALILPYFTEFGNFRRVLRKVVDKAITMDNLRLLCLSSSKRLQRDRATPTVIRYKYSITARWKFCSGFINSRLIVQYLSSSSYRLIC